MAKIKKITVKSQNYDIAAIYDENGNKIVDTYATNSALSSETNNRISSETSIKADISSLQVDKQDKLIAGSGLDITGNVISVLGFHYSKFNFEGDSGVVTSVEGECATAFDSSTNTMNMDTLINIYPFNQIKREEIQLQYADGSNLLNKDRFTTAPNLYYCVTIGSDGQTQSIEFANYKAGDNFKRPYDDDTISRVAIACYLACEDTTQSSSPILRSNTTTNGGIFKVSMSQAQCENELPYYNGEKVDMLDSKVWFFFKALMECFIGYRNGQMKYRGICDYSWGSGNYYTEHETRVSEHIGGTWLAGATDNITSDTLTMTGEVTTWTEDDVTTSITSGKRPFAILGIENPYGLIWQNLGGLYHTDQNLYQYTGTTHKSNSTFDTSDCDLIATDLCSSSEGWQKTLACSNNVCYPISVGGSDSKVVGDYYWYASSNKIFFVGGAWSYGSDDGFSCLRGDYGFGLANTDIGFRLSLKM